MSIRKDDLCKYSGKEHWFSLHPVDPNSEVQVDLDVVISLRCIVTGILSSSTLFLIAYRCYVLMLGLTFLLHVL